MSKVETATRVATVKGVLAGTLIGQRQTPSGFICTYYVCPCGQDFSYLRDIRKHAITCEAGQS